MNKPTATAAALLVAAAVGTVVYLLPPAPPAARIVTLTWGDGGNPPGTIYEIWASTNMLTWQQRTQTTALSFQLRADKPREFFKCRARDPATGEVSDWSHK